MSKQEESRLEKIKQFLGIGGSKGSSSTSVGSTRLSSKELIITQEILKDISSLTPANQRLRFISELGEVVITKRLEENAVEALWLSVNDLLKSGQEERRVALQFLHRLIKGQNEHLGILKAYFFKVIQGHNVFEDLPERLELFKTLSDEGKVLEYFEEETGPFLLDWMKEVMSSSRIGEFLQLLVKVIKFNAAHLDEPIISGLVLNTCIIATRTGSEEDIETCLTVLDSVVCYSYLPSDALHHVIICLCRVVNVERFSQGCWALMRKLLGTHLGHSGIYTMCCLLQDRNNVGNTGAQLLRGAIFFVGMALWGYQKISSLKHPVSAVLPSLLMAFQQTDHEIVAYELVLSMKRLVNKYGREESYVKWDIILDITNLLVTHIEAHPDSNPRLIQNTQDLISLMEDLYEQRQFTGSPDRLFTLVERCAHQRPDKSVLLLISYKVSHIHPTCDGWISALFQLVDRYLRNETNPVIRMKTLEVLKDVVYNNRQTYEEDLVEAVVLPHMTNLDTDPDTEIRTESSQLIVDLTQTSTTSHCLDLLRILNRVIIKPSHESASSSAKDTEQPTGAVYKDIEAVIAGLTRVFKTKLYQSPGAPALFIYEMLVQHALLQYQHHQLFNTQGSTRKLVFECFLGLYCDEFGRLGLRELGQSKPPRSSPYISCVFRDETEKNDSTLSASPASSAAASPLLPSTGKTTILSFNQAFSCILVCLEQELDWTVLKLVLEQLPVMLQNKGLLLTIPLDHFQQFCTSLFTMVGDSSRGLPDKLINKPEKMTKSDFHCYLFPVLTALTSYHVIMDKPRQRDLVKCLEFGLVSKCSRICVRALTVCAYDMQEVMMRQLPAVLLKLSQVSATVAMAIPLMEFLSSLIHLPQLYTNFVEDQYMSVFAIALPYTNPFKYGHYAVSLAYHVVAMWFLRCRLPFRRSFVGFIVKGLRANVHRQFEELELIRSRQNEDSSFRKRTTSMDESWKKKREAMMAKTGPTTITSHDRGTAPNNAMALFHKELTETCIDMLARYTFSDCTNMPKRSPVAELILAGGQSQKWLLGHRLVTITTCSPRSRMRTSQTPKSSLPGVSTVDEEQTVVGSAGRRRHRSATVKPLSETPPMRPSSQDDILLHRQGSHDQVRGSHMSQLSPLASSSESLQSQPLQDLTWTLPWAEVHIRTPTGNTSWMLRLQNGQCSGSDFAETSFDDLFKLYSGELVTNLYEKGQKIDSEGLGETEYDSLHEEHFHSNGSSTSITDQTEESKEGTDDKPLTKSSSSPDLAPTMQDLLQKDGTVQASTEPKAESSGQEEPEQGVEPRRSRSQTIGANTMARQKAAIARRLKVAKDLGGSRGGMNPNFVFLQLYHSGAFAARQEERPVALPAQNEVVNRAVKMLDLMFPYETHKIGVVYVGSGQVSSETEILSNLYGSPRYTEFLQGIGTLLPLQDCNPETVYIGGLDLSGADGKFAYTWHSDFMQVLFHVATLMPNRESDPNCNAKKLHIGNDYVHIIYNDSGEDYKLGTIKGQFNYVSIVIQPLDHATNAVRVQAREDIEDIIGHTDTKVISDNNLANLVRQMAVHANLASMILQRQKTNPRDPYASNWLERLRQLKRIHQKVQGESERGRSLLAEDFSDYVL